MNEGDREVKSEEMTIMPLRVQRMREGMSEGKNGVQGKVERRRG